MARATTDPSPWQPWRRARRWRWVAAVWLASPVLYVLSVGPAAYAVGRDWAKAEDVDPLYRPLFEFYEDPWVNNSLPAHVLGTYVNWANRLGREHASSR